ncbi:MAG: site-specific integrase [Myxococcales bacterium]|nr:site-specific integrase [Myxococcales bacterium]
MPRLTQKLVDSLRADERDRIIFDETIPGFGVRVFRSGRKSYMIQYRSKKRTRRFTLGNCNVLTPLAARKKAQSLLADVCDGKDPAQARLEGFAAPTVADLVERYLNVHAAKKKSGDEDRRNLEKDVLPVLGRHLVEAVTCRDMDKLHAAIGERAPITANRVLAAASTMFGLAERWGMRAENSNPCRRIRRFRENHRERFLSEHELARLGSAIREFESEGHAGAGVCAALRLLILTGARKGEIRNLEWSEVDLKVAVLRLHDSKTGPKVIRLGAAAVEILAGLERKHTVMVFPGTNGTKPIEISDAWRRVRARAGLAGVRLHDLRHCFASVGINGGVNLEVIGALLGHTRSETTRRYAHLSDDPIREASERIDGTIAAALAGNPLTNEPERVGTKTTP